MRISRRSLIQLGALGLAPAVLARSSSARAPTIPRKVLLIDLDDVGKDILSDCIGLGMAPNIAAWMSQGLRFERFWAAPICSQFRARLLTGLDSYRPGNYVGCNVEINSTFAGPTGTWITAAMPGRKTKRGKWHMSGDLVWPDVVTSVVHDGYDEYTGCCANLYDGASTNYYSWVRGQSVKGGASSSALTNVFATDDTFFAALADVNTDVEFVHASFNAVHVPLNMPPAGEPPYYTYVGGTPLNKVHELMVHLDWRLGALLSAAVPRDYVVFIACDNGTAQIGKGSMYERGVCTPFFVLGNGVPSGVTQRMVAATDLWATVRYLRGASYNGSPDSRCFVDEILPSEPAVHPARRMMRLDHYLNLGNAPDPGKWQRAIRDPVWKLIDSPDADTAAGEPLREFFNLADDPTEKFNLLDGPLDSRQQGAFDRLWAKLP